jgi:hypothetical protein
MHAYAIILLYNMQQFDICCKLQYIALTCPLKLPHQVDNSKLEIPVLNVLGMNSIGVLSPRDSWGLNSL